MSDLMRPGAALAMPADGAYGLTPMLRIADVLQELNIARRTLYTEPYRWLWTRAVYIGPRSPRWERTDLELFKAQRRAA